MLLLALFGCDPDVAGPHALAFDGPPDCGLVDLDTTPPDSFTVELWMRGDTDAPDRLLPLVFWSGIFELSQRQEGSVAFTVGEDGDGASSSFSQMDGVLHHLAGTYDGADGTVRLFVDGKVAGANTAFSGEPDTRIQFGCAKQGVDAFYGVLDELRISSTVRYTEDFERPGTAFEDDADTFMLFHLDEGTGSESVAEGGDYVMTVADATWVEFSIETGEGE